MLIEFHPTLKQKKSPQKTTNFLTEGTASNVGILFRYMYMLLLCYQQGLPVEGTGDVRGYGGSVVLNKTYLWRVQVM